MNCIFLFPKSIKKKIIKNNFISNYGHGHQYLYLDFFPRFFRDPMFYAEIKFNRIDSMGSFLYNFKAPIYESN